MGDTTAVTVLVKAPRKLMRSVDEIVKQWCDNERTQHEDHIRWAGWDVRCGSSEEIASALRQLMRDGDEDRELPPWQFAFEVWEDPKYEWLGELRIYVPSDVEGLAPVEFSGECDADGTAVVKASALLEILNKAETIEDARAQVKKVTGELAEEAWRAYTPTQLPQQLALPVAERGPEQAR